MWFFREGVSGIFLLSVSHISLNTIKTFGVVETIVVLVPVEPMTGLDYDGDSLTESHP